MSELFSLAGLITFSIASLISIKTLQLNVRVSRDINVGGTGNLVIVNEALAPAQRSFKLLWQVLVILIALSYPVFGVHYNTAIRTLAVIAVPLALIALVVTIRVHGPHRLADMFYVAGTVLGCWLAYCSSPYLAHTAANASNIYPLGKVLWTNGVASWVHPLMLQNVVLPLARHVVSVVGFAALFLSLIYLVFAYLTARSFDDAVRFSLHYVGMAIIGFIAACDGLTALQYGDFCYLARLMATVWPL